MRWIAYAIVMLIFANVIPSFASAQQYTGRLADLYNYVEKTDSVANKRQRTFFLEKFLKDNHNYRETWRYTENGGRIVFFQVDYIVDSTEFTEVYYVNRGSLVCSEEYEKVNYSWEEDELKFGSIYYFESTTPRHVVILGRRSDSYGLYEPEHQVLSRFSKRYAELKRHLPMLPK